MKLVCIMPVRNEDWCLGLTARAVLMWCDELILLDHCSTDDTPKIWGDLLAEYPGRVAVILRPDPTWREMAHRQELLEKARDRGATHIAMVDADEILTGNILLDGGKYFRCEIKYTGPTRSVLQLPWIQLRGSIDHMHNAGVWAEQQVSMALQDSPELFWAARDGYDFHHRHPMGRECIPYRPLQRSQGGLMHLQMVSERRLKAKQASYKMQEVIRWPGRSSVEEIDKLYNLAVYGDPRQAANGVPHWVPRDARRAGEMDATHIMTQPFAEVPVAWWSGYEHLMQYLDVDAEPWQEKACIEMMKEHGPEKFRGLDLFGVCG